MAQDAVQQPWASSGEEKQKYVRQMFAEISSTYDLMNSAMSLRMHHRWRADAVKLLNLNSTDSALDVCCGTGDFGRPLRKATSGALAGVDFCQPMLALARQKPYGMHFALGDACRLPFADGSFDAATIGWGLRNVPNVPAALDEINRVLRPGNRFVCVDMAIPRNAVVRAVSKAIFHTVVPLMGAVLRRRKAYVYLPKSTETFLSREQLLDLIKVAGFSKAGYEDRFFGNICIHWGQK